MEQEKQTAGETEDRELPEDEGRPPVDPKNKLYTVISLLIFAVLYCGWQLIKENIYFSYALYSDRFTPDDRGIILREINAEDMPDSMSLKYVRLHRNFDGDALYAAFDIPEELTEEEDFPENVIPFPCALNAEDERLTVYPDPDVIPDYVYGDIYGSSENPYLSCMIYESDGSFTAVYRYRSYRGSVGNALDGGEKIPVR